MMTQAVIGGRGPQNEQRRGRRTYPAPADSAHSTIRAERIAGMVTFIATRPCVDPSSRLGVL